MHAALFEHQEALEDDDLVRYAADLGLDSTRIRRELAAHVHADRVREDFESGVRSGVRGTPTFFVDDVRYDGLIGVNQLLSAIGDAHPDVVDESQEGRAGQRTIPRVVRQQSPFKPSPP